jgi:two-component system LytT family sensor kinase
MLASQQQWQISEAGMYQKYPFVALQQLRENPTLLFWVSQVLGWLAYSLITFFALTVWDDNVSWSHVAHIALQAGLGILCCWPLRYVFQWARSLPMPRQILVIALAVTLMSLLWTASRMALFMWLADESGLWSEFNDWYFGSVFVFLSWTAIYYGFDYYRLFKNEHEKLLQQSARQHEEYLRRVQAESSMRDAQLQMLRYQLNPHFLFNTLNAINAMVALGLSDKAQTMIEQLSKFLRHAVDTEAKSTVTLEEELFNVRLYLEIEQARFEDRLTVSYYIDPAAQTVIVPSLILQPLVENSMKYAISTSEAGGVINISAEVVDQRLCLDVRDSGPGMPTETWLEGRGTGLSNTLDRLEVLYRGDFEFEATPVEPSGLNIHIDIPVTYLQPAAEEAQVA